MDIQFLYEIQQQENNHKNIMKKISEIQNDLHTGRLKDEYIKLKEEYSDKIRHRTDIEKQLSQKKLHNKMLKESKANYEKLLYTPEINSIKKLEILKKQIADTEKSIESEMHNMEALDKQIREIDEQILGIKKKLVFIKKKYEAAKSSKEEELDFLLKEKENIEELIKGIILSLGDDSYNEYCKMKERLNNPIAEANNRKCGGCGMEIPILDYEAAKSGKSLRCQNCGRILFYRKNK